MARTNLQRGCCASAQIVSLCVIGSTLCMIFEDPMEDSHSERNIELTEIGTVFSVLFLIEFLFKVGTVQGFRFSLGLVYTEQQTRRLSQKCGE